MNTINVQCTLGPNDGPIVFHDYKEVSDWLAKEKKFWSFFDLVKAQTRETVTIWQPFQDFYQALASLLTEISQAQERASEYEALHSNPNLSHVQQRRLRELKDFEPAVYSDRLKELFKHHLETIGVIASVSTQAKFIANLSETNSPVVALYACGFLMDTSISYANPVALRGALAASYFERGLSSRTSHEQKSLSEMKVAWNRQFQEMEADITIKVTKLEQLISATSENLDRQQRAGDELLAKEQSEWTNLHKAYDDSLALQKPVRFWSKKAQSHRFLAGVFGAVSLFVAIAVFVLLYQLIAITLRPPSSFLYQQGALAKASATNALSLATNLTQVTTPSSVSMPPDWHPDYWRIAVLIAAGVFSVWIVRIVVRLFLSHVHLLADANERITMAQTYLSLLRNKNGLQEKDRELILQALFRPAATGVVKDDGVPLSWIEAITKSGGRQ